MKKLYVLVLLLCGCLHLSAQDKKTISEGTITISTNQRMKFTNLRFVNDQVVFNDNNTKSDFTYFMNSIKSIVDDKGTTIYLKTGEKLPVERVLTEDQMLRKINPPLRDVKQVYAKIVFKNGTILRTYIKTRTSILDSERLDELSIDRRVVVIDNNEKVRYKTEDIDSIKFVDYKYNNRVFVGVGEGFREVLYDGKIKWYRMYSYGTNYKINSSDFMYNTEINQWFYLGAFTNRRKKFREMTILRPDLLPFIEEMSIEDKYIVKLLYKYEKDSSNN
ncbi:hypothetical protein FLAN108750_00185 [Flavobacterium antarcticum]|uniref:hypothetical protein n=1 Tax=Flavobacterium antarcticum TaxID=271155 RepID=UPI0003B3CAAB|nr:hypothetical protein [Flavobacterium antarcticum]